MSNSSWPPSADIYSLQQRAVTVSAIRDFFAARQVWEVDTPLVARYSVTDPHMEVFDVSDPLDQGRRYFLQTSPEYAMKRLLAAGSGPIYQISKAFRRGESGKRHNPEFTLLEWYRPDYDHFQLMDEVEALVASLLNSVKPFERKSYRDIFIEHLAIDPNQHDCQSLRQFAHSQLDVQMDSDNRDDWLNLLLAECIEPQLGIETPLFIFDYPASQAALAKIGIDDHGDSVAQRFELYSNGVELANGYFELTDEKEQAARFENDNKLREKFGKPYRENDVFLLAAMAAGLPSCAGVALGLDRLMMLILNKESIKNVVSFSIDRI